MFRRRRSRSRHRCCWSGAAWAFSSRSAAPRRPGRSQRASPRANRRLAERRTDGESNGDPRFRQLASWTGGCDRWRSCSGRREIPVVRRSAHAQPDDRLASACAGGGRQSDYAEGVARVGLYRRGASSRLVATSSRSETFRAFASWTVIRFLAAVRRPVRSIRFPQSSRRVSMGTPRLRKSFSASKNRRIEGKKPAMPCTTPAQRCRPSTYK